MSRWILPLVLVLALSPGCAVKFGKGLGAGLAEGLGAQRDDGLVGVLASIEEADLFARLGQQLADALKSGATDITPEQRAALEGTIDSLLDVTAKKTGQGWRREVSPAMRDTVANDIVGVLVQGMRGELAASMDETAQKVARHAVAALRDEIADEETKVVLSDLLRDSIYLAVTEGRPGSQSIGETLETTLTRNMLFPVERSVNSLTDEIVKKVDEQAKRTERVLQAVITALAIILGIFVLMYALTRRQLQRQRDEAARAERGLRSVGAALRTVDEDTRGRILGKLDEYRGVTEEPAPARPGPDRRSNYLREDE